MDDQRLKDPKGWIYFDELLARIREIRASEKRFYQKVRELFALSSDYSADDTSTQLFFVEVQNKLHFAATDQGDWLLYLSNHPQANNVMKGMHWEPSFEQESRPMTEAFFGYDRIALSAMSLRHHAPGQRISLTAS